MKIFADIRAIFRGDPALRSRKLAFLEIFLYQGLHAILLHRIAHFLWKIYVPFLPRLISQISRFLTGIEIHPGAKIGGGFFVDHGSGTVIGETAEIGNDVLIYHQVTLGTLGGAINSKTRRHPKIGDRTMIGAGAKIFGPIEIGSDCKIGGGSVVTKNVPSHSAVVGNPARIIKIKNQKIIDQKGKMNFPDPIKKNFEKINLKIKNLEKILAEKF